MQLTGIMAARQEVALECYMAGEAPGEAATVVVGMGLASDAYDGQSAVYDAWIAIRQGNTRGHATYDCHWRDPYLAILGLVFQAAFADARRGAPCLRRLNRETKERLGYPALTNHMCGDQLHFCARDAYEWLAGDQAVAWVRLMDRDVRHYSRQVDEARAEGEAHFRWCFWEPGN